MNHLEGVNQAIEGAQAQMQTLRDQIAIVTRSLEFLSPFFGLLSRCWRIVVTAVTILSTIYVARGRSRSGIVALFLFCTTPVILILTRRRLNPD